MSINILDFEKPIAEVTEESNIRVSDFIANSVKVFFKL